MGQAEWPKPAWLEEGIRIPVLDRVEHAALRGSDDHIASTRRSELIQAFGKNASEDLSISTPQSNGGSLHRADNRQCSQLLESGPPVLLRQDVSPASPRSGQRAQLGDLGVEFAVSNS